jgi:hypothetical protein
MTMIEIWGYLSMIVVLTSMLMKNMKTLRIVNIVSCTMFIFYGVALSAYPIIIMNFLVILINLYRLNKGE